MKYPVVTILDTQNSSGYYFRYPTHWCAFNHTGKMGWYRTFLVYMQSNTYKKTNNNRDEGSSNGKETVRPSPRQPWNEAQDRSLHQHLQPLPSQDMQTSCHQTCLPTHSLHTPTVPIQSHCHTLETLESFPSSHCYRGSFYPVSEQWGIDYIFAAPPWCFHRGVAVWCGAASSLQNVYRRPGAPLRWLWC